MNSKTGRLAKEERSQSPSLISSYAHLARRGEAPVESLTDSDSDSCRVGYEGKSVGILSDLAGHRLDTSR